MKVFMYIITSIFILLLIAGAPMLNKDILGAQLSGGQLESIKKSRTTGMESFRTLAIPHLWQ